MYGERESTHNRLVGYSMICRPNWMYNGLVWRVGSKLMIETSKKFLPVVVCGDTEDKYSERCNQRAWYNFNQRVGRIIQCHLGPWNKAVDWINFTEFISQQSFRSRCQNGLDILPRWHGDRRYWNWIWYYQFKTVFLNLENKFENFTAGFSASPRFEWNKNFYNYEIILQRIA